MLLERGHDVVGPGLAICSATVRFGEAPGDVLRRSARTCATSDRRMRRGIRRRDASGRPFERSAGRLERRLTYEINYHASVASPGSPRKPACKRFIFASSCSNYGAAGDDCHRRDRRVQPGHALRRVQGRRSRTSAPLADDNFCPRSCGAPRRMGVAATALRTWSEQPDRLRADHGRSLHEERRHAVAADRAHRGHLRAPSRVLEAPREFVHNRRSTSARPRRTTRCATSPRSCAESCPGTPNRICRGCRSRPALLPGELRNPRLRSRVSSRNGRARARESRIVRRVPSRRPDTRRFRG